MRADTPPPMNAPKKVAFNNNNKKGKEKVKPAARKVTKEAAAYGMEAAKDLCKNPMNEKDEERIWKQIAGYRRMFPELDHNYRVMPDSSIKEKLAELRCVQEQLGDASAFKAAKLLLTMSCAGLAMGNKLVPMNPLGPPVVIDKLPTEMKQRIEGPEAFLNSELKELTILYPWLFRPGPELRTLIGIYQVATELRMGAYSNNSSAPGQQQNVAHMAAANEDL